MAKGKLNLERELTALRKFMDELENDPALREQMERNQRKYGTLTESDLKKTFTI